MSDLYYLTEQHLETIKPYFPRPHGVARVDYRRVISGIIHVLKRGLQPHREIFRSAEKTKAVFTKNNRGITNVNCYLELLYKNNQAENSHLHFRRQEWPVLCLGRTQGLACR